MPGPLEQRFGDQFGWEELAAEVARVRESLPEEERSGAVVLTGNYGHAGALEYWRRRYDVPPVYSGHNSYWLWGPPPESEGVVLAIDFDREVLERVFDEVVAAGRRVSPHAREDDLTVWLCRGPHLSWAEVWPRIRHFI